VVNECGGFGWPEGAWKLGLPGEKMAMRLQILGSGSSGNCALLQTEDARVLIDAGFSWRKLNELLRAADTRMEEIDAVFLTHEHGDHAAGVDGFKKHPRVQIYANAATARAVQAKAGREAMWKIFETGTTFRFRDLEVTSFMVPHDAQEPVGFRFSNGHEGDLFTPRRSLAWLTDLGHAPGHVYRHLRESDVVVVESNHCPRLLEADHRRPWSTKQRISGRHGHLSNVAACELLEATAHSGWRRIFLTHLSRDCNSLEAVEQSFAGLRARLGEACGLEIVAPGGGTNAWEW
jgi:Metal-dependent hydrolases of the beta-lactamase superfamily I